MRFFGSGGGGQSSKPKDAAAGDTDMSLNSLDPVTGLARVLVPTSMVGKTCTCPSTDFKHGVWWNGSYRGCIQCGGLPTEQQMTSTSGGQEGPQFGPDWSGDPPAEAPGDEVMDVGTWPRGLERGWNLHSVATPTERGASRLFQDHRLSITRIR